MTDTELLKFLIENNALNNVYGDGKGDRKFYISNTGCNCCSSEVALTEEQFKRLEELGL